MHYKTTAAFDGDTAKAFGLAAASLTGIGFRTVVSDGTTLEMAGPGMHSSRQSALLGATRIRVQRAPRELVLEAELGGAQSMARFVTLFPVGLSLFLAIVLSFVFSVVSRQPGAIFTVIAVTGVNALVWLILGPVMARSIYARTSRAMDALLHNMAEAGKST